MDLTSFLVMWKLGTISGIAHTHYLMWLEYKRRGDTLPGVMDWFLALITSLVIGFFIIPIIVYFVCAYAKIPLKQIYRDLYERV